MNGTAAITEAYFNALTKSCADNIDAKWQGKLEGIGVWTDEHCERIIISEGGLTFFPFSFSLSDESADNDPA